MGNPTKNRDKVLTPAALSNTEKATQKIATAVSNLVDSYTKGPQLLFSGEDAIATIAKILPTVTNITVITGFGPVELRPGTIWSKNRILISADTTFVRYAIGDRLYEWDTSSFLREEWFTAAGSAVAQAEIFITLTKFEIALLSGLFVPWYLLLGIGVASIGLTYYHNREVYNIVLKQAPIVLRLLNNLRERSPTLFDKLATTVAKDILVNLPSGVSNEDIGFFIGRVLKGVAGVPEVTLGIVLRIVIKIAAFVSLTHLPAINAEAIKNAASTHAGELRNILAELGITVTNEEAEKILSELLANPDIVKRLSELQHALEELIPLLDRLSRVLHE